MSEGHHPQPWTLAKHFASHWLESPSAAKLHYVQRLLEAVWRQYFVEKTKEHLETGVKGNEIMLVEALDGFVVTGNMKIFNLQDNISY